MLTETGMESRVTEGTGNTTICKSIASRDASIMGAAATPGSDLAAQNPTSIVISGCSRCSRCSRPLEPAEIRGNSGADQGNTGKGVRCSRCSQRVDFAAVNAAARRELPVLLARWLPDGRVLGHEYTARNPRRADRNPGSFRVNLRSGRWADFATGDGGGDPISLAAFLFNLSQSEAARRLAEMLGVS